MIPDRMRVLISYHYFRTTDLDALFARDWHGEMPEVFADSGAYSALTQGADIRLDEYAAWVKRWSHWFTVVANLDTIGDGATAAAGTAANQRRLEEDHGLTPLPVFHAGEPWDALEAYLDAGYAYIALGGLVGRPVATIMAWLVECFQRAAGRAVFHGFGLTSWEPLAALPWYSVDSSSWGSSFRFGQVRLFDLARGRWRAGAVGDGRTMYRPEMARLVREHGFDPADFADRSRYTPHKARQISAIAWWRAEQWIRARHGPVTISEDRPRGLRWYCADAARGNLIDGSEGLERYLADPTTAAVVDRVHGNEGLKLWLVIASSDVGDLRAAKAKEAQLS